MAGRKRSLLPAVHWSEINRCHVRHGTVQEPGGDQAVLALGVGIALHSLGPCCTVITVVLMHAVHCRVGAIHADPCAVRCGGAGSHDGLCGTVVAGGDPDGAVGALCNLRKTRRPANSGAKQWPIWD